MFNGQFVIKFNTNRWSHNFKLLNSPDSGRHRLWLHSEYQAKPCNTYLNVSWQVLHKHRISSTQERMWVTTNLRHMPTYTHTHTHTLCFIPGKIKMKKALIPPITLMTSLMSGTNMAMRRVIVIQMTVRITLQRFSNECVTPPRRWRRIRNIRSRMTDLCNEHKCTHRLSYMVTHKNNCLCCPSGALPSQQKYNWIDGDDWYSK